MTNEEMHKTMEFLLENQARYTARIEKDEERLARLEAAFVTLVELARSSDERMDGFDEERAAFDHRLAALDVRIAEAHARFEEAHARFEEAHARFEEAHARLTEAQAHTDERLNVLIAVVERSFGKGGAD